MEKKTYCPINCEFHDELESASTLQKKVTIVYRNSKGNVLEKHVVIKDLGIADHADGPGEYMTLDDGTFIRLDRIVSVDGIEKPAE